MNMYHGVRVGLVRRVKEWHRAASGYNQHTAGLFNQIISGNFFNFCLLINTYNIKKLEGHSTHFQTTGSSSCKRYPYQQTKLILSSFFSHFIFTISFINYINRPADGGKLILQPWIMIFAINNIGPMSTYFLYFDQLS